MIADAPQPPVAAGSGLTRDRTPSDILRSALTFAVLAPSGHNAQPWRFRIAGEAVELFADRTRALPVADPDDRELTIACGAALCFLRLALRSFGFATWVETFPEPGDPDLLARVQLAGPGEATDEERALFAAIPQRHTNRRPFNGRPVAPELVAQLQAEAASEGAWLQPVPSDHRHAVVELVGEGDRIEWADKRFRRELAAWLHPERQGDGLPDPYMHGFGPHVVRSFDLGRDIAKKDRRLAEEAPLLAVLGTTSDSPPRWLAAGQALGRVLLRARTAGVDASFLNQPVQVAALRFRLAETIGHSEGFPQLLMRMGYGPAVKPAPRRPLDNVVTTDEAAEDERHHEPAKL